MSTSEKIVLDPTELTLGARTEVAIHEWIDQEGADWGEATIEPFLADKDRGSVPVDFRVPNREITIPLRFTRTIGGTTTVAARAAIQAKAALFQKEGGWIKRLTNSGGTVYADIVDASFAAASVAGYESTKDIDLDAHLTLTCLPDFYEQEQTLGDHVETSNPELVFTETNVSGDYPARVRMVVDDDQGQDQRGLLWGFRSRYYDSSATAALKYNAEALEPLDTASKVALSGASGGTVVKHGTLSTNWTPVLGTNKGGDGLPDPQGNVSALCPRLLGVGDSRSGKGGLGRRGPSESRRERCLETPRSEQLLPPRLRRDSVGRLSGWDSQMAGTDPGQGRCGRGDDLH